MMAKDPDSIMTIEEVATYLKIPKSTAYILAQEGKIPCQKVGRQWRFRKETIDMWLDEQRRPRLHNV
jgi:excisionase family DNA binding protein